MRRRIKLEGKNKQAAHTYRVGTSARWVRANSYPIIRQAKQTLCYRLRARHGRDKGVQATAATKLSHH